MLNSIFQLDYIYTHPRFCSSCFPTTIITRVLNCGLKDFCSAGRDTTDRDQGARKKIPKMASVVGILGHLASKHQQDIRKALMALFEVRVVQVLFKALMLLFEVRVVQFYVKAVMVLFEVRVVQFYVKAVMVLFEVRAAEVHCKALLMLF